VPKGAAGKKLVLTEEQALEIITFMVSSAEICLHEPIYYGTFRLTDGASRLIGMILENNPETSGEFFKEYKDEIDLHKMKMIADREGYYEFLRHNATKAAAELKRVRELGVAEGGKA
jgi:hypothetical protein